MCGRVLRGGGEGGKGVARGELHRWSPGCQKVRKRSGLHPRHLLLLSMSPQFSAPCLALAFPIKELAHFSFVSPSSWAPRCSFSHLLSGDHSAICFPSSKVVDTFCLFGFFSPAPLLRLLCLFSFSTIT